MKGGNATLVFNIAERYQIVSVSSLLFSKQVENTRPGE